jgi:hypothetical protein
MQTDSWQLTKPLVDNQSGSYHHVIRSLFVSFQPTPTELVPVERLSALRYNTKHVRG